MHLYFPGLLPLTSKERSRISSGDGIPRSSDDELEQETSFTNFGDSKPSNAYANPIYDDCSKPVKDFANPLYDDALHLSLETSSDSKNASSGEDEVDEKKNKKKRRSSKTKQFR